MQRLLCRVFFSLAFFVWGLRAGAAEELTLTVLFTSDVHAHLLPQDQVRQRPARGSLAQVASLVEAVRRENPLVVVLDGGDTIQGTPIAHYALTGQLGQGQDPTVTAMNLVGYDAATLGNHEFNYGLGPLRRAVSQSRFPWLAANVGNAGAAGLGVKPWVVLHRGPLTVGVVGITNPRIPFWDPPEHWQPLSFTDPMAEASKYVAQLRPQVDVLILVAHSGFERDLKTGIGDERDAENFAWRLAQLPGVDLLLTGHTHRDIRPQKLGHTWVAQPGRWAELVTRFDLHLVREGRRFRLARVEGKNVPVAPLPAHPQVVQALAGLQEEVEAELARPLGELLGPLKLGGLPVEDDPSVDLVHRVQLWATGAQLSLAAPLAAAPLEFPKGPLTPRLAHALYPYPNSLVVVRVTGQQLREILEHAARGYLGLRCSPPGACELLRDERLPAYNYDTLEGASYLVDPTAPQGQRIRKLEVDGKPLAPGATFTLVVNSYRAAGGGGYPHLREAQRVKWVDKQMVDLLVAYFQAMGRVLPQASENWFFAPRLVLAPRAAR